MLRLSAVDEYPYQVGGHTQLVKPRGSALVYKPLNANEHRFYEKLRALGGTCVVEAHSALQLIRKFTPRYFGSKEVVLGSGHMMQVIMLEDLVDGFRRPCVLDLKMGRRQRKLNASPEKERRQEIKSLTTTSHSLGFRICGCQLYDRQADRYHLRSKLWGRRLDEGMVERTLELFLYDGHRVEANLILPLLEKLQTLAKGIGEARHYRFWSSSLLVVYDGGLPTPHERCKSVDIRLIDFANTIYLADNPTADCEYLFGLKNLSDVLQRIATRHTPSALAPPPLPRAHSSPHHPHPHPAAQQQHKLEDLLADIDSHVCVGEDTDDAAAGRLGSCRPQRREPSVVCVVKRRGSDWTDRRTIARPRTSTEEGRGEGEGTPAIGTDASVRARRESKVLDNMAPPAQTQPDTVWRGQVSSDDSSKSTSLVGGESLWVQLASTETLQAPSETAEGETPAAGSLMNPRELGWFGSGVMSLAPAADTDIERDTVGGVAEQGEEGPSGGAGVAGAVVMGVEDDPCDTWDMPMDAGRAGRWDGIGGCDDDRASEMADTDQYYCLRRCLSAPRIGGSSASHHHLLALIDDLPEDQTTYAVVHMSDDKEPYLWLPFPSHPSRPPPCYLYSSYTQDQQHPHHHQQAPFGRSPCPSFLDPTPPNSARSTPATGPLIDGEQDGTAGNGVLSSLLPAPLFPPDTPWAHPPNCNTQASFPAPAPSPPLQEQSSHGSCDVSPNHSAFGNIASAPPLSHLAASRANTKVTIPPPPVPSDSPDSPVRLHSRGLRRCTTSEQHTGACSPMRPLGLLTPASRSFYRGGEGGGGAPVFLNRLASFPAGVRGGGGDKEPTTPISFSVLKRRSKPKASRPNSLPPRSRMRPRPLLIPYHRQLSAAQKRSPDQQPASSKVVESGASGGGGLPSPTSVCERGSCSSEDSTAARTGCISASASPLASPTDAQTEATPVLQTADRAGENATPTFPLLPTSHESNASFPGADGATITLVHCGGGAVWRERASSLVGRCIESMRGERKE
ncbi:unnamed protein product [Vitrella brassicaformis CCMP3155]|uniref:Kinase n=2 Tax=Vitrella brassicaformis TaxID=1169539 RepID=A0A0G4EEK2_VITBC|nr:unnamed protein product [Vitrella brassicaformis CCMP3155]|eukprot:CEL93987.1 unnamed protein product [Vitrella brassicaformis CCMP3155]